MPTATRPPSSGGNGSMLKIASNRLILIKFHAPIHIENKCHFRSYIRVCAFEHLKDKIAFLVSFLIISYFFKSNFNLFCH